MYVLKGLSPIEGTEGAKMVRFECEGKTYSIVVLKGQIMGEVINDTISRLQLRG